MADVFENHHISLESPAVSVLAITPGAADIDPIPRAIYIGTPGDVTVEMVDGTVATFVQMQSGWHPIRPLKITAGPADIVGVT